MANHGWLLVSAMSLWPGLALAQPEPIDEDEPAGMVDPEESEPVPDEPPPDVEPLAYDTPDAEDAAAEDAPAIEVHGFASLGYTLNALGPDDGANRIRVFDGQHNTFSLDGAELVVQRVPTAPGQAGFRVDLAAGTTIPQLSASAGMGLGSHLDLQQAYGSWVAPVGDGLRLDAGKFMTWAGSEVIEGYDGFNDHYSHSWLFGYAIPFGHVGVRGGYPVSPRLTVSAMISNGWDVAVDNNAGKTWGVNAAIAAGDKASVYVTYIGGPEQAAESGNLRNILDVVAVMKATDQVTVTANATVGHETLGEDSSAMWYGAALYGRYDTGGKVSVSMRGELFADPDGYRMLAGEQTLIGLTVTPSYKLDGHLVIRGDLRFDHSTEDVFLDQAEPTANQLTLGLNVIGAM